MYEIPTVKKDERGIPTLYVKGEPFLVLGGEIHNSGASDPAYMAREVWPRLRGLHMNTVVVPLYWECIEPEDGVFCFDLPDALIAQAREEQMHLIFLWFGLWKNSESSYVPGWMKRDGEKYFWAEKISGEKISTISPFCEAAVSRDAVAFRAVMAHIRETDEAFSTVLFMQVENEIGVLDSERDYSPEANRIFEEPVPDTVAQAYGVSGSWKEAFGENAEEYFMAYGYACAVERIASAGREAYPLPCYANAWLRQYPWKVGTYPSGGPVRNVHEIWKLAAPALFTLAPDIYVPYVADILDEYGYEGNPLFVPEVRKDAVTGSYCLYAFGEKNAIGWSPFGIEEVTLPPESIEKPPMELMAALNIDPSAFDITGSSEVISCTYDLMEQMKPLYLQYRGTDHMKGYVRRSETDYGAFFSFTEYDLSVAYDPKMPGKPVAGGIVMELAPNRFLLVGMMSTFRFHVKAGVNRKVDYLMLQEGHFLAGKWRPARILNGDERNVVKVGDRPVCLMAELYQY